jgi:hypothetical protein
MTNCNNDKNESYTKKDLTIKIDITNIEEFKDVVYFFVCMLEDNRIDKEIREQYYNSCRFIKDNFFVNLKR